MLLLNFFECSAKNTKDETKDEKPWRCRYNLPKNWL